MADGDRLQLFYELCGAWCAFIPRLKKVTLIILDSSMYDQNM